MKILLLEDIKSLGKRGEIVEVKDGYGQNFLIAKGKAKLATNEVVNRHKAEQRNNEERLALERVQREALAKNLENIRMLLSKKCGENGALFGAITKEEISLELQEKYHFDIDKKHIEISSPIKHLGDYQISINLGHGIHANLTLTVVGV